MWKEKKRRRSAGCVLYDSTGRRFTCGDPARGSLRTLVASPGGALGRSPERFGKAIEQSPCCGPTGVDEGLKYLDQSNPSSLVVKELLMIGDGAPDHLHELVCAQRLCLVPVKLAPFQKGMGCEVEDQRL